MQSYSIDQPLIHCANVLGECPLWDSNRQTLFWIDIELGLLHEFQPETLDLKVHQIGQKLGCIALTETDRLLLATEFGFAFYKPGDPPPVNFLDVIPQGIGSMFNDGKVSPAGEFWAGSKGPRGTSKLYRISNNLSCSIILENISISNGIGWSLDSKYFYHTDSLDHSVYRYTLKGKELTNKEVFYSPPRGTPDGLTIDADGNLWTAIWDGGRVVQLSPEAKELAQILLPVSRPTSVTFCGTDLRTLYITSASVDLPEKEKSAQPFAGALFSFRTQVAGLPSQRFILRA
ncbi:MAG TPA: SMP-30/gluconolactonase/LRE family protein [Anaerolineaceae bacterium]|nr:SMP-30/gluconolactonase/LRE family protein [Anaerolineaceae bacterium]